MSSAKSNAIPKRPTKSADSAEPEPTVTRWTPKPVPLPQDQTLSEAFPDIDPGLKPFGSRVLLQIRAPRERTGGGIYLPDEVQDTERWNNRIAKVIGLGPGAFRNRDTLQLWPEGEWAKVGDFIWCPKYGGQRHQLKVRGKAIPAMFVTVNDLDLIGQCTIDPLKIIEYL